MAHTTDDPTMRCSSNFTYFPVAPLPPLLAVLLTTGHPTAPSGPFLVYTRSLADLMGSYTTHPLRTFLWDLMSVSDQTFMLRTECLCPPNSHVEALIPNVKVLPVGPQRRLGHETESPRWHECHHEKRQDAFPSVR